MIMKARLLLNLLFPINWKWRPRLYITPREYLRIPTSSGCKPREKSNGWKRKFMIISILYQIFISISHVTWWPKALLVMKHMINWWTVITSFFMMTSSNGNIFRVTGSLCGEFTGPCECPTQRPVTRSFDVFFDLRLNKRLSKQPWGWWFETLSWSLWRHRNVVATLYTWRCETEIYLLWLMQYTDKRKI